MMNSVVGGLSLRVTLGISLGVMGLTAAEPVPTPPAGTPVVYEVDRTFYRNFVKNWDDQANPVMMAYIRTPEQYQMVFNSAAVMWEKSVFRPNPEIFATKSIVLVARTFNDAVADPFEVKYMVVKGRVLEFHFTLRAGSMLCDGRSYNPKCGSVESKWHPGKRWISVMVPKSDIQKLVFIENNTEVGSLNISAGQWVSPASPFLNP